MMLHFKTASGQYLNINTSPENYNQQETNYDAVLVSDADYNMLLNILDFNMVNCSDDLLKTQAQHDVEAAQLLEAERDQPWN